MSVIMPAFNAAEFIEHAIRSVCAQTYSEFELIVVDDGSTDQTASVVRQLRDPRIVLVQRENGGEPAARNTGLSHATGELIAFLDADDQWTPRKLEKQVAVMSSDPEIVAVGTLAYYFGRTFKHLGTTGFVLGNHGSDRILSERIMPFPISSLLTTRAASDAVGGFNAEVPQAPDYGFVLALAKLGKVTSLPERLTGYRLHGNALSEQYVTVHRVARYFEYTLIERDAAEQPMTFDAFADQYTIAPDELRRMRARGAFRNAGVALFDGNVLRFVRSAFEALALSPRYCVERLWSRVRRP